MGNNQSGRRIMEFRKKNVPIVMEKSGVSNASQKSSKIRMGKYYVYQHNCPITFVRLESIEKCWAR